MKKRFVLLALPALAALVPLPARASNDPKWSQQYGPQQIGAPTAWTKSKGGGVRVAIVDSGSDLQNPDLKSKIVEGCPGSNCHDFGDGDDNPDDDSNVTDGAGKKVRGHGSHVAGITAAATDNNEGIAGVAPDAKLMPLKIFGENGSVLDSLTAVPNAVDFAVSHGAKVLNLSLGDFNVGFVGPIQTACNQAFSRGSLCIVAAGNSGSDKGSGYNSDFNAVVVTANDSGGNHASFGQKADTHWALSAPGVGILSTVPVEDGTYGGKSGTSMAAPHVAGVAALLFAQGLTNRQVAEKLVGTASPMGDRSVNGAGIVNAAAAVGASAPPAGSTAAKSGAVAGGAAATAPGSGSKRSGAGSSAPGATTPTTPGEQGGDDDFTEGLTDSNTAEVNDQAADGTSKGSGSVGDDLTKGLATVMLLGVSASTFGAWRRRPV